MSAPVPGWGCSASFSRWSRPSSWHWSASFFGRYAWSLTVARRGRARAAAMRRAAKGQDAILVATARRPVKRAAGPDSRSAASLHASRRESGPSAPRHTAVAPSRSDVYGGGRIWRAASASRKVAPMSITDTLEQLKTQYVELHTRKEDLFWVTKMGVADDMAAARRAMAEAEIAWNGFLQDPERLASLRALAGRPNGATEAERRGVDGWVATLAAHVIEDPEARKLSAEIVELEAALAEKRAAMPLGYVDPATGKHTPASSVRLALMMRTDSDEARRRAAYEGLKSIEPFVLDAGFLEIVEKRNRLGRMLGHEDYYAWRVAVVERMSKQSLFDRLDALAARTAEKSGAELAAFEKKHGPGALEPWNFRYLRGGDIERELDPYFGFADAFERWGRSFHALGVRYRGATLTLDLVDRPGKYENGFMHGPGPAYFDGGAWRPARVNFTANAVVGQIGSGLVAAETLFHEGGHAAHFANILADAPC